MFLFMIFLSACATTQPKKDNQNEWYVDEAYQNEWYDETYQNEWYYDNPCFEGEENEVC